MSYNIYLTDNFKKEAKKLIKKYASLQTDLSVFFDELSENPTMGKHLGNDIYKIRIAISSKGKGKSGGARILSYVKVTDNTVLLFSIYSKGTKDDITDKEIQLLIKEFL